MHPDAELLFLAAGVSVDRQAPPVIFIVMSEPHVAVVILNYNGQKYLETYLPPLLACKYANSSLWVVDNQSVDGSLQFLANEYPEIKVVLNSGNLGFAEGYNEGLKTIIADYYVLLNSDVKVTAGFIGPVIDMMEKDKSIAFAQPKILALRQPGFFEYAGASGGVIDSVGYPFCRGRVLETLEKDEKQYDDDAFIFWASGACFFARASVYEHLGGMYGFYYMQNEEIDLCWRAQNLGYKIAVCGSSEVYHLGGGSLEWENPKKTFFTFRNNLVLNTRNMPVARLLWLVPFRMALDSLAAARFIAKGKTNLGAAVLRGILSYWRWLLWPSPGKWPGRRGLQNCQGVFWGSIVWQYFAMGRKKYAAIIRK